MRHKHIFGGKRVDRFLDLMERLVAAFEKRRINVKGGIFMFVLPNDHADVPFTVSPVSATDAEGETITLTEELKSDNEDVVSFLFAEGSSASNPRAGQAHIGHSGVANVNYTAKDASGNIVVSKGSQFTISTGAVANVSGGDVAFEGITES